MYIKKIKEQINKISNSKNMFRVILSIGIFTIAILIFSAGLSIGFYKASFGRAWGEHYNENFGFGYQGGHLKGFIGNKIMPYFPNSHGATGKIIKIEPNKILIQGKDNLEKIISIDINTKIEQSRTEIKITDLNIGDFIVAIGTPNDTGFIEAKFIRLIKNYNQ